MDLYIVVSESKKPKQKITPVADTLTIGLPQFLDQCALGVPQALEALWSPVASVHPAYAPLLAQWRPCRVEAVDRHRRTALSMVGGTPKKRLHALRVAFNTLRLWDHGWYNPRLSAETAVNMRKIAEDAEFLEATVRTLTHVSR